MYKKIENSENYYYNNARDNNPFVIEIRGIINYRDLLLQLIRRDLIARYKRSVLGVGWSMLNPLGTMVIITIVFSQLFHRVEKYPAYLLSGLLAWNFFAQTTNATMQQIVWGSRLFQRIYLPRTTFTIAAVGTGLVNFLFSLIPFFIIMFAIHVEFTPALSILPISILLLSAFTLGVGLFFSSFAIFFPDVREMYQISLTAWMYLTPIIYPVDILPENLRPFIINLNPMYHFIQLFRLPMYEGRFPDFRDIIISACISLSALLVGWYTFTKKASKIAYYV